MSKRDEVASLRDMLNHARKTVELLGDAECEELGRNRVMQLALTRLVEIIGEAANSGFGDNTSTTSRCSLGTDHRDAQPPDPRI